MPGMSALCRNIAVVKFPGRTFFLAVNSFDRRSALLVARIDALREAVDPRRRATVRGKSSDETEEAEDAALFRPTFLPERC
jgi:hypothetical protein